MIVVLRLQDWERFSTTIKTPDGQGFNFKLNVGTMKAWLPVYDSMGDAKRVYPDGPFLEVRLQDVTQSFEIIELGPGALGDGDVGALKEIAGDLLDIAQGLKPGGLEMVEDDDDALMEESAEALAAELGWDQPTPDDDVDPTG